MSKMNLKRGLFSSFDATNVGIGGISEKFSEFSKIFHFGYCNSPKV